MMEEAALAFRLSAFGWIWLGREQDKSRSSDPKNNTTNQDIARSYTKQMKTIVRCTNDNLI